MMLMLMDEIQEVIGPPAVSVTTADVFATIEAKVNLFILPIYRLSWQLLRSEISIFHPSHTTYL